MNLTDKNHTKTKKIIRIVLIAVFCCASMSVFSQHQNVNVSGVNQTLKTIFKQIEQQTQLSIDYDAKAIDDAKTVQKSIKGKTVKTVLDEILSGSGCTIIYEGSHVIIKKATASSKKIITGIVLDETGEPITGANIVEKGSSANGTITGMDGDFSLEVANDAILTVSYIGFIPYDVFVKNQETVSITLKEDTQALDEVVVVGYGTQSRAKATGALSQLKAEKFSNMPITNVEQGLAAQMPGVQVMQNSGAPGGGTSIRVRGLASISADNQPLYVIDGFPVSSSSVNMLNPNDVETIDVLKDAAAAAIYGSRGGNGVVIITTKKGTQGKAHFSFDAYYGVSNVTKKIDMMDAYQYADLIATSRNNNWLEADPSHKITDPNSMRPSNMQIPDFIQPYLNGEQNLVNTDWQDEIFRTAPVQSYSLNVAGSSDLVNYFVSGNYMSQDGVVINTNYQRYSARTNLETRFSEKIKFGLNLSPSYSTTKFVSEGTHGNDGVVTTAIIAHPMFPVYNSDGSYALGNQSREAIKYGLAAIENPVAVANLIDNNKAEMKLIANTFLELNIFNCLKYKTLVGIDYYDSNVDYFRPSALGLYRSAPPSNAVGTSTTSNSVNWAIENTLTYNKQLGDHSVNVLVGHTAQKETIKKNYVKGTGFPNDEVHSLSAATIINDGYSRTDQWSLVSYLARLQYDYKSKYLFSASIRRDGSSRFGKDNRWGYFPSISLGWRISEEEFFQKNNIINDLKIRASYGKTGNFNIPNYAAHALLQDANYTFNGIMNNGLVPYTAPNSELSWEKTDQVNAGFDAGFFKGKLTVGFDYYNSETKDLLLDVPIPYASGFSTMLKNVGKVANKGFEISLGSNLKIGDFEWIPNLNFSVNRNEVKALGPGQDEIIKSNHITRVGEPIGSFYGYNIIGVFKDDADIKSYPHLSSSLPGSYKYEDINNDGVINSSDRKILGNSFPKWTAGFSNSFRYKDFDASIFIQTTQGASIVNRLRTVYYINGEGWANASEEYYNGRYISAENIGNGFAKNRVRPTDSNHQSSNYMVEDASFVRIRNIVLGYTLPNNLSSKVKIDRLRVYVSAQNPFTFTNYSGFNPEVSQNGSDALQPGLDYGSYPASKTFIVGLNLNF